MMKKLPLLSVSVLVFLAFSVGFVVAAPGDYKSCVPCTQNGYKWMGSSVFCGSGCKVDCPWTCWYNGCAGYPSECPGYCEASEDCGTGQACVESICTVCSKILTQGNCESGGDCCWIPPAEGYEDSGKCVANSEGCENKFVCGGIYCEEDESCCPFLVGTPVANFECYDPATQECSESGVCVPAAPGVTADPIEVYINLEDIPHFKYHTITVTNKDSPTGVCQISTFELSYSCPSGWKCSFDNSEFSVSAGGNGIVSLKVEPPSTLSTGTYSITVYAINTRTNKESTAEINYEIESTTPTTTTTTTTPVCSCHAIVGTSCEGSGLYSCSGCNLAGICTGDGTNKYCCSLSSVTSTTSTTSTTAPTSTTTTTTPKCWLQRAGYYVNEGSCEGSYICSGGSWVAHCGDGIVNCAETTTSCPQDRKCTSNADCCGELGNVQANCTKDKVCRVCSLHSDAVNNYANCYDCSKQTTTTTSTTIPSSTTTTTTTIPSSSTTTTTTTLPEGTLSVEIGIEKGKSGWSIISFLLKDATITTTCEDYTKILWYHDPSTDIAEPVTITNITKIPTEVADYYKKGWWFKTNEDCKITVSGTSKLNISDLPELKKGKSGWNIIPVPYDGLNIEQQNGTCTILAGPYWHNSTDDSLVKETDLKVGYGYWIRVKSNCQLG